jgi:hypothetical protein
MKTKETKKIAEELKNLKGLELVNRLNNLCKFDGKVTGWTGISINDNLKQIRVDQSYYRLAKRIEKVMAVLGYTTGLDCRTQGTVTYYSSVA